MKKTITMIQTTIGISAITESIRTIITFVDHLLAHSMSNLLNARRFMWHSCAYAMVPVASMHRSRRVTKRRLPSLVGVTDACMWHATGARTTRMSERS